jgi:hypothetical protein
MTAPPADYLAIEPVEMPGQAFAVNRSAHNRRASIDGIYPEGDSSSIMKTGSELAGGHSARLPKELIEPNVTIKYGDLACGWA